MKKAAAVGDVGVSSDGPAAIAKLMGQVSSAKPAARKTASAPAPTSGGAVVADDIPFNKAGEGRSWLCM